MDCVVVGYWFDEVDIDVVVIVVDCDVVLLVGDCVVVDDCVGVVGVDVWFVVVEDGVGIGDVDCGIVGDVVV